MEKYDPDKLRELYKEMETAATEKELLLKLEEARRNRNRKKKRSRRRGEVIPHEREGDL